MTHQENKTEIRMKKVRIDETLLQQVDYYDFFPKGMWSRQGRINYCVQVGLAVLLTKFQQDVEEIPKDSKTTDNTTELLNQMFIQNVLQRVNDMRLPRSQVIRLLNRSLYE